MNKVNVTNSRFWVNLIGAPLVLFVIFLGGITFSLMMLVVMLICFEELHSMLLLKNIKLYRFNIYFFLVLALLGLFKSNFYPQILNPICLLIFIAIILIFEFVNNNKVSILNVIVNICTIVWIAFGLYFVIRIRSFGENSFFEFKEGFYLTLIMFLSIWLCDSFAYIFGSKFGKSKLCPSISPKKTWMGSISGFVLTSIFIYVLYLNNYFDFLSSEIYKIVISDIFILSIIFGVISQIGDLFESWIKRKVNVKDSGRILQGHGGMLDRLDSLLFVAPTLYLYLKFYIELNI